MILSTFLAKLLGLYFIILALLWFFRQKEFTSTWREFAASKGLLAVSAEFSIVFGLIIAIDHTIWEWSWQGLVTVIGYLLILRGIVRLGFPSYAQKMCTKMLRERAWPFFLIMLVLGAYLAYCGFAFHPD